MICSKCGKNNPSGARFCAGCGADLSANDYSGPSAAAVKAVALKSGIKNKLWLIILIAVVIVLVILFSSGVLSGNVGGGSSKQIHTVTSFYDYDSEKTYFVVNGDLITDSINGNINNVGYSTNSDTRLFLNDENELYILLAKSKTLVKVASDVYGTSALSGDGKQVLYVNDDGVLYQYDVSRGEKTKIVDDVSDLKLSPNGKAILYSVMDDEDSTSTMYVYINGEKEKIGDELFPLTISDDGKDIYYYNSEKGAVYYTSYGSDDKKKIQSGAIASYPISNSSNTQIIFGLGNEKGDHVTYFSEKGGDAIKISGVKGSYIFRVFPSWEPVPVKYPNDVLTDKYYRDSEGTILYLDSKFEIEKIAGDTGFSSMLSSNSKIMVCIRNDNLYRYDLSKGAESEKIASDVLAFDISRDGSTIYYINDDDELYMLKGKNEPVKIASDVGSIKVSHDDIPFFMTDISSKTNTGTLYAYNGKEKVKIANDATRLGTTSRTTFYCVYNDDDDYDVFMTKSGYNKFSLYIKGIALTNVHYNSPDDNY